MTTYTFYRYEELRDAIVNHLINSDKHIILTGSGNNGKTTLINSLRSLLEYQGFDTRLEEDIHTDIERESAEEEYEDRMYLEEERKRFEPGVCEDEEDEDGVYIRVINGLTTLTRRVTEQQAIDLQNQSDENSPYYNPDHARENAQYDLMTEQEIAQLLGEDEDEEEMPVYLYRKTIIDTKQDLEIPNSDTYLCKFMFDSFGNQVRSE